MMRQMFKLMWNRKRRNLLLMIEIMVSFLLVFAIAATLSGWGLQLLEPIGFNPDNLWVMHVEWEDKVADQTHEQVFAILQRIESELKAFEEVENVAWGYANTPYSSSVWRSDIERDGREIVFDFIAASDQFANVLGINVVEGSWFGPEQDAATIEPVVIDQLLAKQCFGDSSAIGGAIADDKQEFKVVGVVDYYRYRGEFVNQFPQMFRRIKMVDGDLEPPNRALVRVKPGTGVSFENTLALHISAMVPTWSVRIENLAEKREGYFKNKIMALLVPGVIGFFLIFNVALGLFGVLWYSINRRRAEIGLRRAMGATASLVNRQILGEALVLATFGLAIGVLLAVQAPILSLMGPEVSVAAYILAILVSAVVIYVLVGLCAWYPARLAGLIHPAEALHDE